MNTQKTNKIIKFAKKKNKLVLVLTKQLFIFFLSQEINQILSVINQKNLIN